MNKLLVIMVSLLLTMPVQAATTYCTESGNMQLCQTYEDDGSSTQHVVTDYGNTSIINEYKYKF